MASSLAPLAAHPLDRVLAAVAASPGLCVFDLDSTLFDNRPRQALILRELGVAIGEPLLARVLPEHFRTWDLAAAMRNAGLSGERAAALAQPAARFWKERFFSSAYCRHDVPVPGAVAFVAEVRRLGAPVAYLTGRPHQMEAGTLAALAAAGFPLPEPPAVRLFLKPDPGMGDDLWKERAGADLARLGPVAALFDNEPAHINGYRRLYPRAACIHLATDDSGRPIPLLDGITSVGDFRR